MTLNKINCPNLFLMTAVRIFSVFSILFFSACSGGGNNSDTPQSENANRPPQVNAGEDQIISLPTNSVQINATATDDGLPAGSTLIYTWIQESGPGASTFDNPNELNPTVTFDSARSYVLQLTVSDGELSGSDTVTITVNEAGSDPVPPGDNTISVYCEDNNCDEDGWTVFTPSEDTRIMYISAEGDDETAQFYLSNNPDIGDDPFNPNSSIHTFATYSAAYANSREGYPDWILYKRGDIFYESPGNHVRSGRGIDESFLIGSYGSNGDSPLIKTDRVNGVNIAKESPGSPGTYEYIAIQGLEFYSYTRNPTDPDFAGYQNRGGKGISINTYNGEDNDYGNYIRNVLVEGCSVSYYTTNIGTQGDVDTIYIRRNVILNSYAIDSHAQGLWAAGINGLLVEENIFDHNGWLIQAESNDRTDGGATFHNHNVYTDAVQNGTLRKNIFMRASSIGTKLQGNSGIVGLRVDDNLYIDGEIGIESCNNYQDNSYRVHDPIVSNNIFYQLGASNPTLRNVGWGMWIQGWDGGSIRDNILLGQRGQFFIRLGEESRGIDISNNIGMLTDMYSIYQDSSIALYDIEINNNYFERLNSGNPRLIYSTDATIDEINFSNNTYYNSIGAEFSVDSITYDSTQWTTDFEPTAEFEKRTFVDEYRTPETYMGTFGEAETMNALIEKVRSQDKYNWDFRYTAEKINNYIREGFGTTYN